MIVKQIVDGKIIARELTQEEIDEMNKPMIPQEPTLEERISSMEDLLLNLL